MALHFGQALHRTDVRFLEQKSDAGCAARINLETDLNESAS
jgi:hypothetical protein